jgi:hypothetical protein
VPLAPGNDRETISRNISELTHHGSRPRSHSQIVAIALDNARRHPHHAGGGGIGSPGHIKLPTDPGAQHPIGSSMATPWWTRSAARQIDRPAHIGFDAGGGIGGPTNMPQAESPNVQAQYQQYLGMSAEQLQELAVRTPPNTPQGQLVQRALMAKRMTTVSPTAPASPSYAGIGQPQGGGEAPMGGTASAQGDTGGTARPMGMAKGGSPRGETSILAASSELVIPDHDVEALGHRGLAQGMGRKGETALALGHRLIDEMIHRIREWQIKWLKSAPPPKT